MTERQFVPFTCVACGLEIFTKEAATTVCTAGTKHEGEDPKQAYDRVLERIGGRDGLIKLVVDHVTGGQGKVCPNNRWTDCTNLPSTSCKNGYCARCCNWFRTQTPKLDDRCDECAPAVGPEVP